MPKNIKLLTLSQVMPKGNKHDSVKESRALNPFGRNETLLQRCNMAWENLRDARNVRERVKEYCYGDQWGDVINTSKYGLITERDYMSRNGEVPLSNNIMISLLNSIVGLYAKQGTEPVCFARTHGSQWLSDMMSATMQCNWQNTQMEDLLKHGFEEFLIGGGIFSRETYERRDDLMDSWTDLSDLNYMFWEGGSDARNNDFDLIGQLHDISPEDLYHLFAKKEYGQTVDSLNKIYGKLLSDCNDVQQNERNDLDNINFTSPSQHRMCRVIEVWTKETKNRYQCWDPIAKESGDSYYRIEDDKKSLNEIYRKNAERKEQYDSVGVPEEDRAYIKLEPIVDKYWYYTFMAPDGTILCEGESPYDFKSHPYCVKLFPYINGEIHPYMSFVIDQQRYINRLIVLDDIMMRSSSKGITLVPDSIVPENMGRSGFVDQLNSPNPVVFYNDKKSNPNAKPEVVTSGATNIGTNELLQIELNLIRDISNVSGALQGKTPTSGTSASSYAMQSQNATTSLYSILKDYSTFVEKIAQKKCSNIKQFYEDGRLIYNKDYNEQIEYDKLSASNVKFMISIKESEATAAYQMNVNDRLDKLLQDGQIDIIQYLSNINAPFADKLLQSVEKRQQEMQQMAAQQQQMSGAQVQNGVVQGADQQKVQQAQQILQ